MRFLKLHAAKGRKMIIVKLLEGGLPRVLNGQVGMTFIVDKFSLRIDTNNQMIAHVRDYRYGKDNYRGFQIWTLGDQLVNLAYEVIHECLIDFEDEMFRLQELYRNK